MSSVLCPGLFCRTMRRRAVAAVSAACLPGLLVRTILGNAHFCQLLTPRLHMQLRVVTTAVAACLAGLRTKILTLRRAGAYYWRPSAWAFTLPCAEADAAHTACAFVTGHCTYLCATSFPVWETDHMTLFPYMGKLTILIGLVMFSQLTYPVGKSCGISGYVDSVLVC